ncbi:MAG: ATP-binding cassette domain-containing protein [Rhizobiaceae bacterium]|nr:ATP-binding cassette domain-containing protein [Rhizobiaceae bacterium]MCV0405752.1 ATP-binding cassette domain-containing protein [Rhizobiaceae bacterium]
MLEIEGLTVSYGRHRALEGASAKVGKGEICVILGANGAGKSTLLKAVAGMVRSEAGSVTMNGRPIGHMKPHRIVEEGVALVPEGRGIFGDLTVAENLQLGAFARRARREERAALDGVYTLFPRLAERRRQVARTMSGGEQQMVAIGRALMSRPDILMLDEPSLGLSPLLTRELFKSLTEVARTGVGILLVEQNARQSLRIAGRGYLIENGQVSGGGSAEALASDPAVIAAYLGGAAKAPAVATRPAIALPPGLVLPAGVDGIARSIGEVAARAGAISRAFVRAARREAGLPSAFVGRYDPKADGNPWDEIAAPPPPTSTEKPSRPPASRQAAREAGRAALLAERAGERLARHVAQARLSRPVPSAFLRDGFPPAEDHPRVSLNGPRGLIGHNSAGLDIDRSEDEPRRRQPKPQASARPAPTIAELAARAAAIQAAHVAEARKRLRTFTVAASDLPVADDAADKPARKGKKHKAKKKPAKHREAR